MHTRYLLGLAVGLLGLVLPAGAAPRISEFMAENKKTLADEDGAFSDWIEIYNPDAASVDMAGYALTDDVLFPQKWVFPSVIIPSGGHLVVFASGKNRFDPAGTLHTNFQLEKEGEYLALVAPNGVTKVTEFAPTFPPQEEDRSYGSAVPIATGTTIAAGAPCRYTIPAADIIDWNTLAFSDVGWTDGHTGVGYENNPGDATNYTSLIAPDGNVQPVMYNIRGTCYIRVPFNVASAANVISLTLRMKFDDGFIAYINGQKVAFENDPDPPAFNSLATTNRSDLLAVVFKDFDISAFRSALVDGTNVLAIQGLNSPVNSSDFIIVPELLVTSSTGAGQLSIGYFPNPTPGTINGALVDGFVKDTHFSIDHGLYATPQSVAITCNTPNAQIRYTTDGTMPSETVGTLYTVPVNITTTTVLRAVAFIPGWQSSNVDTQTYVFAAAVKTQPGAPAGFPTTWGHEYDFNTGQLIGPLVPADYLMDPQITNLAAYSTEVITGLEALPVMSLVCNMDEIFGPNGIYSDGRLNGNDIATSVEFFGPGAGAGFRVRSALRIHGGDALIEHPKKPFRLYFRQEFGPTKLDYPLFPDSPVTKFDRLQLRPGGHDGWAVPFGNTTNDLAFHATYIRDQFLRNTELAQGRLAPHGRYVSLYINGLYWGVYNLHEVPGNDYFKSYYGGEEDDWDVVEQTGLTGYKIVDGNGETMDALLALCTPPTRPADPLIYDQIQYYLDIDEFIDHMIVMTWAGQNDWMGPVFRGANNVSRFFNKNWDAGRLSRGPLQTSFFFSAWDCEISMGTHLTASVTGQDITDFNHTRVGETGFGGEPGPPAQIYNALRSNATFRQRFADRLQKNLLNDGALSQAKLQARLLALRTQLNSPMVAESARWGDVNATTFNGTPDFSRDTHWVNEMNFLKNTFIGSVPGSVALAGQFTLNTRNNTLVTQFKAINLYPTTSGGNNGVYFNPQFGGVVAPNFQLSILTNPLGGTIYYTKDGTDPFRPAGPIQKKLITAASPCKYWIPTSNILGDTWKNVADPSNIGIWTDGTAALGYDLASTYTAHFSTDVINMLLFNTTVYARIPFTIASQTELDSITAITLRMKADDGFAVFLNGGAAPIATLNAPATLVGNSAATAAIGTPTTPETAAVIFQNIDITSQKANLVVGTNYLCIQGLNVTVDSTDFLCVPELLITTGTNVAGPSPTAITYAGPVTLTQSGPIKARLLKSGVWSAMTEATYVVGVAATSANLVISEFCYLPADPTPQEQAFGYTASDFEFLELYNPSASTIQLTSLHFSDGIDFDFVDSSIQSLAPGARALIVSNQAAFTARYGPGLPIAGVFANNSGLSNAGERIILLGATGNTIVDFTYEDNDPWPNPPSNSGYSLVLKKPETFPDPALPTSWRLSRLPGGSPGGDDRQTFSAWLAANGGSGNEAADPEHDGLGNLLEYALLGDPSQPTFGILPQVGSKTYNVLGVPGEYLTIEFRRDLGAEDLEYHVEFSSDFVTWTENGVFVDVDHHADGSTTEKWRSSVPMAPGNPHQFARVRIVKP
jgi:hypothetical protein